MPATLELVSPPRRSKGIAYILLAFFFMALFGLTTKIAAASAPKLWVSFITYLTGTIILAPAVVYYGKSSFSLEHWGYHLGRAAFGLGASLLYMWSLQQIPLVNATLLFNTAPIFLPLLSIAWLKIPIARNTWWAIALGFLGIIFIIKPTRDLFEQSGDLLGLASGISLAIAYMCVKQLTRYATALQINFFFFSLATLMQLPCLLWGGAPPDFWLGMHAVLAGLCFIVAQIFLVKAYQNGSASELGVFQYTTVIFTGIFGWWLWNEVPSSLEFVGLALVMTAGTLILMHPTQAKAQS